MRGLLGVLLALVVWGVPPARAVEGPPSVAPQAAPTGVILEGPLVGLQVTVDDRPVQPDATGFVPVSPSVEHRLVVRVPMYVPFVWRVTVAPGRTEATRPRLYRETSLPLRPAAAVAAPAPAPRVDAGFLTEHWPSLTALGLGLGALAAGVTCHLLAERDWASLRDAERDAHGTVTGLTERAAGQIADRARARETGSWIGFGTGGGLLLVSTILLALEPFADGDVALVPTGDGAALTGTW